MKRIFLLLILLSLLLLLVQCKKYYIVNALGENNVDVTYLIKQKKYKPVYNNLYQNEIIELINPNPVVIYDSDIEKIRVFLKNKGIKIPITNQDVKKQIIYRSTYFIMWNPVDCFDFNISINEKKYYLEIRIEYDKSGNERKLILPGSDESRFKVVS